jgi:hypothetical protein
MAPVETIDLNDNAADPYPPLGRCYKKVNQAELFVLLVGDTYGTNAKGHNESYTHLEYKYALNESKTMLIEWRSGYSIPYSQAGSPRKPPEDCQQVT